MRTMRHMGAWAAAMGAALLVPGSGAASQGMAPSPVRGSAMADWTAPTTRVASAVRVVPVELVRLPAPVSVPGVSMADVSVPVALQPTVASLLSGAVDGVPSEAAVRVVHFAAQSSRGGPLSDALFVSLTGAPGAPSAKLVSGWLSRLDGVLVKRNRLQVVAASEALNALLDGADRAYLQEPPAELRAAAVLLGEMVRVTLTAPR